MIGTVGKGAKDAASKKRLLDSQGGAVNKRPAKKAGLTIEPPPFIPPVIMPALEPPMYVHLCKMGELSVPPGT